MCMIRQTIHNELLKRLKEKRRFLQVLAGPRQVGKTTLVRHVLAVSKLPAHYASADEPTSRGDRIWLEQQWDIARLKAGKGKTGALLVLDEIQKITDWPNVVKLLWDADSHSGVNLKVVLLGSAPLLIQSGLTESLAGRFEVIAVPHWSFPEMREAFDWTLEQYIFYGAYPGAAALIGSPERWRRYILDSLIETTISRDILLLTRVDKPALLRRLFLLGCAYSGQILSYQKMIGQLTDAGNTITLAHYLELLQGAGMLAGLFKYSLGKVRQHGSSPKLQVLNTALMSAQDHRSLAEARQDRDYWGRVVESAVGAHLFNSSFGTNISVAYWRERNHEVDFVLQQGKNTVAIAAKSGLRRSDASVLSSALPAFVPLDEVRSFG
jgi:uncharacterized protein